MAAPPPAYARAAGQALIELAFFGTLMLVVLSALINFALNADHQQQAMMKSFRASMQSSALAMAEAGTPTAVSHTITEDRIIPDPTHPFEIGNAGEVSYSSSSPVRTFRLGQTADLEEIKNAEGEVTRRRPRIEELSRQRFAFQGGEVDCPSAVTLRTTRDLRGRILDRNAHGCTTESFRLVRAVRGFRMDDGEIENHPKFYDEIDKYNEVYGMAAVRPFGDLLFEAREKNLDDRVRRRARHAYIIDPMDGEIVNYETAQRLCRLLFNPAACKKSCELGKEPKSKTDCDKLCAVRIRVVPWYCRRNGHPSAQLDALFKDVESLGLQPGKVTLRIVDAARQRNETGASVATRDTLLRWHEHGERKVLYHDPESHTAEEFPGPGVPQVFESKDVTNESTVWETPWD